MQNTSTNETARRQKRDKKDRFLSRPSIAPNWLEVAPRNVLQKCRAGKITGVSRCKIASGQGFPQFSHFLAVLERFFAEHFVALFSASSDLCSAEI